MWNSCLLVLLTFVWDLTLLMSPREPAVSKQL
jgi:hypothetical protein